MSSTPRVLVLWNACALQIHSTRKCGVVLCGSLTLSLFHEHVQQGACSDSLRRHTTRQRSSKTLLPPTPPNLFLCSPPRATFFSPRGTCRRPWFAQSGRVTECTKDSKPAPLRSSNAGTSSPQRAAPRATTVSYGYTGALWRYIPVT
jgi:hypothetical protein